MNETVSTAPAEFMGAFLGEVATGVETHRNAGRLVGCLIGLTLPAIVGTLSGFTGAISWADVDLVEAQ